MAPMARVRPSTRLLPALLVSILTLAVLVGAVGASSAAAGDAAPTHLGMAAMHLGDRAAYDATLTGDWQGAPAPAGHSFRVLNFTRAAGKSIRDGNGSMEQTDLLVADGLSYDPHPMEKEPHWQHAAATFFYPTGTDRFLALGVTQRQDQSSQSSPIAPLGVPLGQQSVQVHANVSAFVFVEGSFCLADNLAAGHDLDLGQPIPLLQACTEEGLFHLNATRFFTAQGMEDVAGLRAVRFASPGSGGAPDLAVWLVPGIPYPLRLEASLPDRVVRLDLVGFTPGMTGRDAPVAPGPTPPPLQTAPRKPWGPDDAGTHLKFPPSTAFHLAETDPIFAGLRDFEKAHPHAIGTFLWSMSYSDDRTETRSWWIGIADDQASYSFLVEQEKVRQQPQASVPEALRDAAAKYTYMALGTGSGIDLDKAPKDLPTLAALFDRWALYSGKDPATAGAALFIDCGTGCGSLAIVGQDDVEQSGVGIVTPSSIQLGYDQLAMNGTGHAQLYASFDVGISSQTTVMGSSMSSQPQAIASVPDAQVLSASLWAFPSTEATAGVAIISLLAGLAVYAWPLAKSGGLLLFSRVQGDRLLDHPARADLCRRIEAQPGIHYQALLRDSGLGKGTLDHHLAKLAQAGLVRALRASGYTCYFPPGGQDARLMRASPVLKSDGAQKVLRAIQDSPGSSALGIAQATGLSPAALTYHVRRLSEAGLVDAQRSGRLLRLTALPLAQDALDQAEA